MMGGHGGAVRDGRWIKSRSGILLTCTIAEIWQNETMTKFSAAALLIAFTIAGCAAPRPPVPQTPETPRAKRIIRDGGQLVLPDGTRVTPDATGGFTLPNGDQVRRDRAGALVLKTGARCVPDSTGYTCP